MKTAMFDDETIAAVVSHAEYDSAKSYWFCVVKLVGDCDGNEGDHRIFGIDEEDAVELAVEFTEKMIDRRPILWT